MKNLYRYDYSISYNDWGGPASRRQPHKPKRRGGHKLLISLAIILLAFFVVIGFETMWMKGQLQYFSAFTQNNTAVARILIQPTTKDHRILITLSRQSQPIASSTYPLNCDFWGLQAQIFIPLPILQVAGLHESYQLTALQGSSCFANGKKIADVRIPLTGSNIDLPAEVQQWWFFHLFTVTTVTSKFIATDSSSHYYNAQLSQNSIQLLLEK